MSALDECITAAESHYVDDARAIAGRLELAALRRDAEAWRAAQRAPGHRWTARANEKSGTHRLVADDGRAIGVAYDAVEAADIAEGHNDAVTAAIAAERARVRGVVEAIDISGERIRSDCPDDGARRTIARVLAAIDAAGGEGRGDG